MPGFTAGTCLRKDFAFSEERSNAPGMLLAVSRVNESVPLFVVQGVKRRLGTLDGKKVAVLGLTFKKDSDDDRDSLSYKLIRFLERELADIAIHDPFVPAQSESYESAVANADVIIVATNHSAYSDASALGHILTTARPDCLLVDVWNAFGTGQVFSYAAEVAALTAA